MFTDQECLLLCHRLNLSRQAQTVLATIRAAPPSRRVGSGRNNVPVHYASRKMGVTIQAESYKNELAGVYEMEHDSTVLAFYDQPPPLTLHYAAKNGRQMGIVHTPDFFVIRTDALGWEEWKQEEDLVRLAEQQPARYVRGEDGQWHCPPGEQIAAPLGFYYRIRSSAQIQWVLQRNLRFLADYLRADRPQVSAADQEEICTLVASDPGLTLDMLLKRLTKATSDAVYTLIATEQLFVDVSATPLAEPERVPVFRDAETARAWTVMLASASKAAQDVPHTVLLQAGAPVVWDGRPWTILNLGETTIALLAEDSTLIDLPITHFHALIASGKLVGLSTAPDRGKLGQMVRERLLRARKQDVEEANRRYHVITPILEGEQATENTSAGRTQRRWVASYRRAEQTLGCGYVGLLPQYQGCGNRAPRLPEQTRALLQDFITLQFEQPTQKRKREVYGEFVNACREQGILSPPSYKTFVAEVQRRPRYEQLKRRAGRRAAYRHEPLYWELTWTLPRHGDRPFEIGHLDHTELDIELVDARTGRNLGRPWATLLTDAFSRRILAVFLTFDPPSYRSCMMVLRECVRRHGRLPQLVVVDWGPEFEGTYFETLLARYGSSKASRPKAKPRFGSVIERLFNTANTTFVHNLAGNTQITKHVRQVTQSVNPRELAVWTLGALAARFCEWAYEVYDTREHPALGQTPREAFAQGLFQSGTRPHRLIPYDEEFLHWTLPTTPKGTAKVQPNLGVKINSLYYWAKGDAFRHPEVENTQVEVRYDPYNIGRALALVKGTWVECISEHYAHFQGRSEREVQIATEELRRRSRLHNQHFTLTAAKLAAFITSTEGEAALLTQRQQDEEVRGTLTVLEGGNRSRLPEYAPMGHAPFLEAGQGTTAVAAAAPLPAAPDAEEETTIYEDY